MLVIGNWKMHTTLDEAVRLASEVVRAIDAQTETVEVGVCPPFIWLEAVGERLRDSDVRLGAQTVHPEASGAFTGEISPVMLREVGCADVIVGHSERRRLFGETNAMIARRVAAARDHGLRPILCVGETLDERKAGDAESVVTNQLDGALESVALESSANLVVAYEPVWAIGTGETATPKQAQSMHAAIRHHLAGRYGEVGRGTPILYGGSVKPHNAADLFAEPDLDGGLIGGASLNVTDFAAIVKAAAETVSP